MINCLCFWNILLISLLVVIQTTNNLSMKRFLISIITQLMLGVYIRYWHVYFQILIYYYCCIKWTYKYYFEKQTKIVVKIYIYSSLYWNITEMINTKRSTLFLRVFYLQILRHYNSCICNTNNSFPFTPRSIFNLQFTYSFIFVYKLEIINPI